jgi:hypothetical protein
LRRTRILILAGFGVFVFLAISALLARALSATGTERARVLEMTERSRVLELAQAEARGDARAVLNSTPACEAQPACIAATRAFVTRLKRPGDVEILQYQPSVNLPLTTETATGRVAWRAGAGLPVVQCVRVRREGPISGAGVEILSISAPIPNDAGCPQ